MSRLLARVTVILTVFFAASAVMAAGYQKERPEKAPKTKEKPSIYIVVQLNEEYQVIRKDELKDFRKNQNDQFKAAEKGYKQAQIDAKKSKQKFDQPKPVRPIIKTIPGEYTSKDKAEAQANTLREDAEKAKAKAKK